MNTLFPIFLKADQLSFLIVGGGNVAHEKLFFLQRSSPRAKITLVAEKISPETFDLVQQFPESDIYQRSFSPEDLKGKHLVIAATNNTSLNLYLRDLANTYKFLLNVADQPDYCDFYLGGVVSKGDLKIGISTNGKAPIIAKRLRQVFEEILPPSVEETIARTHELRRALHGTFEEKLKTMNEHTKSLIP